jgi:hypothetical protein
MHWQEFLDTADRLTQGVTEGDWRSSASRAYYAIFHFFREFLRPHGVDLGQGGQCHNNLYVGLNNCGVATLGKTAGSVDDLRRMRAWADYDCAVQFLQKDASDATQLAQSVVADFQTLLATVPPGQIAAGVRRYLRSIGRIP